MNPKDQDHFPSDRFASENIAVIGAGPVGLTASLLLSKYRIRHLLVEELTEPDDHPQAHFINCRSMEILRELGGLDQVIRTRSAPANEWRRFVYCTGLSDLPAEYDSGAGTVNSLLGVVDHFADLPVDDYSPVQVTHFSQHDFVRLLRRYIRKNQYCHFLEGQRADIQEHLDHVTIHLSNRQTGLRRVIQTQFVLGADGAHSVIRKQAGIELVEDHPNLQQLINVHFFSPELADWLKMRMPAMLYFVYSTDGVAIIVSHALSRGEFVAQIPFFPPHQRATDFDENRCRVLLENLAGSRFAFDINSIRSWRMGTGYASRFRSGGGRCFLIGDAAHQVTPAGGFGMNTGIQDAHNLVWKIARVLKGDLPFGSKAAEGLLESYEAERKPVARLNAALSVWNFKKTLGVSSAIGLNLAAANLLSRILTLNTGPASVRRTLFQTAMRLGLKQIDWLKSDHVIARHRRRALNRIFQNAKQETLQLLFPGQDLGFIYRNGNSNDEGRPVGDYFDPFYFKPQLIVGGRMPHFWITAEGGQRISVLDLPTRMMGADGVPRYVLLEVHDEVAFKKVEETEFSDFQPMVRVVINTRADTEPKTDFVTHQKIPQGLPRSFTVLVRPDGHIAWLQVPG
jgi:2-polyprenyl-6-methoxyphenol hydroxylase-like FAD-dependent oxidoreductase